MEPTGNQQKDPVSYLIRGSHRMDTKDAAHRQKHGLSLADTARVGVRDGDRRRGFAPRLWRETVPNFRFDRRSALRAYTWVAQPGGRSRGEKLMPEKRNAMAQKARLDPIEVDGNPDWTEADFASARQSVLT